MCSKMYSTCALAGNNHPSNLQPEPHWLGDFHTKHWVESMLGFKASPLRPECLMESSLRCQSTEETAEHTTLYCSSHHYTIYSSHHYTIYTSLNTIYSSHQKHRPKLKSLDVSATIHYIDILPIEMKAIALAVGTDSPLWSLRWLCACDR